MNIVSIYLSIWSCHRVNLTKPATVRCSTCFGFDLKVAQLPLEVRDGKWHHICITWTTRDGQWEAYQDGMKRGNGDNLAAWHPIKAGGVIILGQEQVWRRSQSAWFTENQKHNDFKLPSCESEWQKKSFSKENLALHRDKVVVYILLWSLQDVVGGHFDAGQAFVGELSQVNIWDRVLKPAEVQSMANCSIYVPGNVISWLASNVEVFGRGAFKRPLETCQDRLPNAWSSFIGFGVYPFSLIQRCYCLLLLQLHFICSQMDESVCWSFEFSLDSFLPAGQCQKSEKMLIIHY